MAKTSHAQSTIISHVKLNTVLRSLWKYTRHRRDVSKLPITSSNERIFLPSIYWNAYKYASFNITLIKPFQLRGKTFLICLPTTHLPPKKPSTWCTFSIYWAIAMRCPIECFVSHITPCDAYVFWLRFAHGECVKPIMTQINQRQVANARFFIKTVLCCVYDKMWRMRIRDEVTLSHCADEAF